MSTPKQKPGKSKQDYGTPWDFVHALEKRFGPIVVDLAASVDNAKAPVFYTKEQDTLVQSWAADHPTGNLYLNPEFANIAPYARKCFEESRLRSGLILMLTPASIGSDWFAEHVNKKALVLGLSPRIPFDGMPVNPKTGKVDGYPKDLMLSVFGRAPSELPQDEHGFLRGFDTWRWKPVQLRSSKKKVGEQP